MKKNFLYNLLYQILILILQLLTMPYVSRILGASNIGIQSYTYSISYYFAICAMLGLNNYGNRTIAKVRDSKDKVSVEFWSIYFFQLIMTLIMIIFYIMYLYIFEIKYIEIAVIQVINIIAVAFDINWFFFGMEKFKITITRNVLVKLLSCIFIFSFVKTSEDINIYALILALSVLISNLLLFPFLKKYVNRVNVKFNDITKHLKPNLLLFLPVIAVSIYKIMDKIMIGALSTVKEVGYYENAEKIIHVPTAIITALGTVMLPRTSNLFSNKKENEIMKLLEKTMPFVMFLTFPMMFGVCVIAKDFSVIFFGKEFITTGIVIQLLSITIIFLAWGNVIRTQYIIPKELDKIYIVSAFLGAIVNFLMNIIFIKKLGAIGACIGTICAEFVVVAYQTFSIRKEIASLMYLKKIFKVCNFVNYYDNNNSFCWIFS